MRLTKNKTIKRKATRKKNKINIVKNCKKIMLN